MKYWLLIIYILSSTFHLFGQQIFEREKRDHVWLLGASTLNGGLYDVVKMDFTNQEELYQGISKGIRFYLSNSSISDSEGNLLLFTNGIEVRNTYNDTLVTNLAPTELSQDWLDTGYPLAQGALFLPLPQSDSIYYLFHADREWLENGVEQTQNLFLTVINSNSNKGQGAIVQRDISIINDTLSFGRIVACRHANGRDWWIVMPELDNNQYYSVLLSPNGVENIQNFQIGDSFETGISQSQFSPSGDYYVRIDVKYVDDPYRGTIYEFDRCTGLFTSSKTFYFEDTAFVSGGVAFSENSRFLYAVAWLGIYQYDLLAEDVSASKVKVLEFDTLPPGGASGTFGLSQLAPDGKIYVSTVGATEYLSIIHKPNLKGSACEAEIRAVELPVRNYSSMPNHAYYGLGPLDGSSCDTLNIDNPAPQLAFDYVIADSTAFIVDFYDGSIFSPDQWYWEFGDGATSTERFPSHTYMDYGSYQVCLTASHATGSNTVCQEILLNINSTKEEGQKAAYKVWPNPSSNIINISSDRPFTDASEVRLYTVQGRRVMTHSFPGGLKSHRFNIGHLNSGIYWLEVNDRYGNLWREKVVVQ